MLESEDLSWVVSIALGNGVEIAHVFQVAFLSSLESTDWVLTKSRTLRLDAPF